MFAVCMHAAVPHVKKWVGEVQYGNIQQVLNGYKTSGEVERGKQSTKIAKSKATATSVRTTTPPPSVQLNEEDGDLAGGSESESGNTTEERQNVGGTETGSNFWKICGKYVSIQRRVSRRRKSKRNTSSTKLIGKIDTKRYLI